MKSVQHFPALQDMALFVEVARVGSFSGAGTALGIPNATVSRRIAALERSLDIRLFNRSTRSVALTTLGRRYLERCAHLIDEARAIHEQLHLETSAVSGELRISMPVDFAVSYVGPLLSEFAHQYPSVRFQLDLNSQHIDLVTAKIDLAIRIGTLRDSGLVARRIGDIRLGLFASPAYLQSHGVPEQPFVLGHHEIIDGYPPSYWKFKSVKSSLKIQGRFKSNNVSMMRTLAERGMGIAMLPLQLAQDSLDSRRLLRVMPEHEIQSLPIQAVMLSRKQPAVVRVFVDYLANRLELG